MAGKMDSHADLYPPLLLVILLSNKTKTLVPYMYKCYLLQGFMFSTKLHRFERFLVTHVKTFIVYFMNGCCYSTTQSGKAVCTSILNGRSTE